MQFTRDLLQTVIRMKRNLHALNINDNLLHGANFAIVVIGFYDLAKQKNGPGGIKISDLSRILGISRPAVTKMINNLEANGYVTKSGNLEDRRYVFVKLTDKGQEALAATESITQRLTDGLLKKLGPEELSRFLCSMNKICDIFSEEVERRAVEASEKTGGLLRLLPEAKMKKRF